MNIVWVNGCFDIVHLGHIKLFEFAKSKGDLLYVGLDSDEKVKKDKGETRPFNDINYRKEFLESIKFIDKVFVFNSDDELIKIVKSVNPKFRVIGSDYKNKNIIGREYSNKIIFFDRVKDYSTTNILKREKEYL